MLKILRIINSGTQRSATMKKNIAGSIFIKIFSMAISLLLVPLTLGYVSSELYGVWLTLSSVTIWLGFFDVGFTLGLKNKLTESLAKNDYEKGKNLVTTTYGLMIIIFVPLAIIMAILIPYVNWCDILNVSNKYASDINLSMTVLVVCFSCQMIVNVLISVLAAFQKVAFSSIFGVLGNFFALILIYLSTIFIKPSLFILSLTISVTPILVMFIASLILYNTTLKKVSPCYKCFECKEIKDLFSLGIKFFIIQIQVVIFFQTTNFLISNISTPNDVSVYNIVNKYLSLAFMFFIICLGPLWPAFTDAYAKKDFRWMKSTYRKMKILYGVLVLGIIIMAIAAPFIYKIWIGNKLIIPSMWTYIVALYMIVNSWDSLQVYVINGFGKLDIQSLTVLIGAIFHIPLSYYLSKYVGPIGVILSMTFITTIYCVIFTYQLNLLINNKAKGLWAQ